MKRSPLYFTLIGCLMPLAAAQAQLHAGPKRPPAPELEQLAVSPAATMATHWESVPGCAKRIAIGAQTQIWILGCDENPATSGEYNVLHRRDDGWENPGGSKTTTIYAAAIGAASNLPQAKDAPPQYRSYSGVLLIDHAYRLGPGSYAEQWIIGSAQQVGAGGGWIWAITPPSGDHLGGRVIRSSGIPVGADDDFFPSDYVWSAPFGDIYAKRLGVGVSDATAWAIGEDGRIYRQVSSGDGWIEKPGCAVAIANGGQDQVWVVGCDEPDAQGNRSLWRWNGEGFVAAPGRAVEVAVQSDGTPWALTADGGIWRKKQP